MSWAVAGVTAINVFSQIQQGNSAKSLANAQAGMNDYQAKVATDSASQTAALIRKAGRGQVGQANTSYAAAGVKVGEGSALETERQIDQNVEHDAFQAILDGQRKALGLQTDAKITRANGRAAQSAGYVNAMTAAVSGYGNAMKTTGGWKTGSAEQYSYSNDEGGVTFSNTGADVRARR